MARYLRTLSSVISSPLEKGVETCSKLLTASLIEPSDISDNNLKAPSVYPLFNSVLRLLR